MSLVSFDLEVKILVGGFRAAYGPTATTEVLTLLMQEHEPEEARVLDTVLDAFVVMTSIPAKPCIPGLGANRQPRPDTPLSAGRLSVPKH